MVEAVAINSLDMVVGGQTLTYKVSLVNGDKQCIYDTYIMHESATLTDYNNANPNLLPHTIKMYSKPLVTVRTEVASLIRKRILIGYDLDRDLKPLGLCHPDWNRRDVVEYPTFQRNNAALPLQILAKSHFGMSIQNGVDSAENALVAMKLYKKYEAAWDDWCDESDDESGSGSEASGSEASYDDQNEDDCSSEEEMDAVAIDCEMVESGTRSIAGKVSLVDEQGKCIYDTYIKHTGKITDYRTWISGLTPELLAKGKPFNEVKKDVASWIRGCVLVGHDLDQDLKSLGLCHPDHYKRDTSEYFRTRRGRPSLRNLALKHLGLIIQNGEHDSIQDAVAAMRLYKKYETEWEDCLAETSDDE